MLVLASAAVSRSSEWRIPVARGMQKPPWQGPMPSRRLRRMSSRFCEPRARIPASRVLRSMSSHSQMSCSVFRWRSRARRRVPGDMYAPSSEPGSAVVFVVHGRSWPSCSTIASTASSAMSR